MRPLNVPPQMEPPRLELLPLFTSPLNVPPLMAKPLNMFTDSLNVPSSIAPLLIPMTMQSNVPPVMVPEEVLTYDFVGSFGSLLKVPPAMMPAFPMLAVNAPPLITPPASLRTAKPDVCDASTNVPSSMTPLFRRRFSLETVERVARERERVPRAKRELAVGVRPAFSRRADRRAVGADFDGDGNSARECDVWVDAGRRMRGR